MNMRESICFIYDWCEFLPETSIQVASFEQLHPEVLDLSSSRQLGPKHSHHQPT